ncbi:MAG: SufD family Fe-S cluster assembly protein [Paludibacteraceae bacterium]|nr:SufD family Fe-S cluster assembly protein [Paludibacteraceae bacterium]
MEILSLNNEEQHIVLSEGEKRHIVLLNPLCARLFVQQQSRSELSLHCLFLPESESVSSADISIMQDGKECRTVMYGMALLCGKEQFSLETHVLHNIGGGYSEQTVKCLLADSARGSFYGELVIAKDAQKTEAHQTNRNILLSPNARMDTKPQLEIYADDVKASHGATTGQLDAAALFYMQQRGIALQDARRMLLHAFLSDVMNSVPADNVIAESFDRKFNSLSV